LWAEKALVLVTLEVLCFVNKATAGFSTVLPALYWPVVLRPTMFQSSPMSTHCGRGSKTVSLFNILNITDEILFIKTVTILFKFV